MDRLTVLCFGGTYGLALVSELARFAVRGAARWYLTVGLTALGWAVQTAYLVNLAVVLSRERRIHLTLPEDHPLRLARLPAIDAAWARARERLWTAAGRRLSPPQAALR